MSSRVLLTKSGKKKFKGQKMQLSQLIPQPTCVFDDSLTRNRDNVLLVGETTAIMGASFWLKLLTENTTGYQSPRQAYVYGLLTHTIAEFIGHDTKECLSRDEIADIHQFNQKTKKDQHATTKIREDFDNHRELLYNLFNNGTIDSGTLSWELAEIKAEEKQEIQNYHMRCQDTSDDDLNFVGSHNLQTLLKSGVIDEDDLGCVY